MPRPTSRTLRLTAVPLTALLLTMTACGTSDSKTTTSAHPSRSATATPTAKPALTKAEAVEQIERYSKINNQANAKNSRALLDTVEDGPLYAMSIAGYKEDEGLLASQRETYKPWSYDTATADLYIPRFTAGQRRWFAARIYSGTDNKYARLIVMAEQPGNTRWEMTAAIDLDDKNLPKIALDQAGYATAVDAANGKQLAATDSVLRSAVIDNFASGGTNTGQKVFAKTKASKRQVKVHDETGTRFGSQGTTAFAGATNRYPNSYALKTTDGGALVVFAHAHTQTDAVTHAGLQLNPGKTDRAWLGTIPRTSITYTFVCSDVAAVPAKSAPSRLLGYTCARTDAHGPALGT